MKPIPLAGTVGTAANLDSSPLLSLLHRRPRLSVETLAVIVSLFFTLTANPRFFHAVLANRDWSHAGSWGFALAMVVAITALHASLLLVFSNRWSVKPLITFLLIATAAAGYYMDRYTVFFNADMIRNIMHTDVKEAGELFTFNMFIHMLVYAGLPIMLLWRVDLQRRTWRRALGIRLLALGAAILVTVISILLVFQDFSSLMRNQKEIRFLINPGAYLTSLVRVAVADTEKAGQKRIPISGDAKLGAGWAGRTKPMLFVLVVGETTRGANWGLNGYARQTTPELTARGVTNFSHATSCGTNTEVSVPCMFSTYGRRNYDEKAIRSHESLLHIIDHVGVRTVWRDNQGGCKGVCDGLEQQRLDSSKHPTLCNAERCLDEIMLENMDGEIQKAKNGNLFMVLHQLGSHGPSYFNRYPAAMRRFTPTCDTADLSQCSREQIVNTFDNTVLYTDHFLARTIDYLKQQQGYDTAMLYLSDHGESLGENGIFLHGLPYSIAPKEQTQIPMVMWMSPGFASSFNVDAECLSRKADRPVSQDNLFHSLLGMLQISSKYYDKSLDFTADCHSPRKAV